LQMSILRFPRRDVSQGSHCSDWLLVSSLSTWSDDAEDSLSAAGSGDVLAVESQEQVSSYTLQQYPLTQLLPCWCIKVTYINNSL
jgi:hypothetical protein